MNAQQLIHEIERLCRGVRYQTRDINSGGCALFAGEVAKALQDLGIEAWCRSWWMPAWGAPMAVLTGETAAQVRKRVRDTGDPHDWEDNGWEFMHCTPRFKLCGVTYEADAEVGVRKHRVRLPDYEPYSRHKFTPEEMLKLYSHADAWNSRWDRRQTPTVQRLVSEFKTRVQTFGAAAQLEAA